MTRRVLIMAGGTGGHIMPGLAVAEALQAKGWQVAWLGNPQGMEARLVAGRGFEMAWLEFSALRGKGLLRKLALPLNLLRGVVGAWRAFSRLRPDVVIGFGGYITFPGGLVAALRGVPLVLHEQNAVAGLANRVLSRLACRVLCGFPEVLRGGEWVGNPVRNEIAVLPAPSLRFAGRAGTLNLLVLGGSLGAQALNTALPAALAQIPPAERPQVVHQAGARHRPTLQAAYAAAGVQAHCVDFIEDMAGAYAWADLVICRAGALTVAELACAGVASILVPFPHAVDDHQTANARFLTEAGAAILLPQSELTAENLVRLRHMSRSQLLEMAEKARALARPQAALRVAEVCEEICHEA